MPNIHTAILPIKFVVFLLIVVLAGVTVGGSGYTVSAQAAVTSVPGRSYRTESVKVDDTPHQNIRKLKENSDELLGDMLSPTVVETSQDDDGFVYCSKIPLTEELQQFTYERCEDLDLDYSITLALMWRESTFNKNAVGYNSNGTRDHGIMQINDVNVGWLSRELNLDNIMDPEQNITAGTKMLSQFTDKYGLHNGLMAYQMGEQGMINRVNRGNTYDPQIEVVYNKSAEFQNYLDNSATAAEV